MSPEEIAQTQELSDLVNIGRRSSLSDSLEFVGPGFHALFGQPEAQISHIFASEFTFRQIDLDLVCHQPVQQRVELLQVLCVVGRMQQQVINIHDYIGQTLDDSLHQPLKTAGRTQQTHRGGDPLELALARYGKCGVRSGAWLQQQLPETSREVDRGEQSAAGATNVANALTDVLHGILVHVGLGIQSSEVLDQSDAPVLLGNSKDGAVKLAAGWLNDPHLEPFVHVLLDLDAVGVRDFELLDINRLFSLQSDVVQQRVGAPQIELVPADTLVILQYHAQITVFQVFRHIQFDIFTNKTFFFRAQSFSVSVTRPLCRSHGL